jgi:hypothetical protein
MYNSRLAAGDPFTDSCTAYRDTGLPSIDTLNGITHVTLNAVGDTLLCTTLNEIGAGGSNAQRGASSGLGAAVTNV